MFSATRKLPFVAFTGISFIASKSIAQEAAAQVGAEVVQTLHKSGIGTTLKEAFLEGKIEAWQSLAIDYGPRAVILIVVMIVGYMFASYLGRISGSVVSKKVDLTLGRFISRAIRNGLMLIMFLGALTYFDVDVTSVAAILAALGFAIGMALQGTLSNFAAGVMLLVFRPFKVDDYIVVAGTEGTVEEIDLFTTRLNSLDNRHLIIPNGEIFGSSLENYSHNQHRRVDVNVGADYGADLQRTRAALEEAVHNIEGSVTNPEPQVYLWELGASSVDWQVRVWCRPADYWEVRERLTAAAKESLGRHGIGIPYPQLDVHVVGKVLARAAA